MSFTALYDACVLYPFALRDLLIELAGTGSFCARWTDQINQEWTTNLCHNHEDITLERLSLIVSLMGRAVPDWRVTGYEELIPSIFLPDQNDRHVLAAAICGKADVIVTTNIKDFPSSILSPFNIEAQHPDEFLVNLTSLKQGLVCSCVKNIRNRLKRPPFTAHELLNRYEEYGLIQTAGILREYAEIL